jgi:uncharacterized repeat protein (TIGR01451 family)
MTRRWLILLGGLLLGTSLASFTWGEEATHAPSLAQRMSALSHSWFERSTAAQSGVVQASHTEEVRNPHEPAGFPQIDPRSLIPSNLFSRSAKQPASSTATRSPASPSPQAARGPGSPAGASTSAQRSAIAQRQGALPGGTAIRGDFTLPGLGGSSSTPTASSAPSAPSARGLSNREEQLAAEHQKLAEQYRAAGSSRRPPTSMAEARPYAASPSPAHGPAQTPRTPATYTAEDMRREISGMELPAPEAAKPEVAATEVTDQPATAGQSPSPATSRPAQAPTIARHEPTPTPMVARPQPSVVSKGSQSAERGWAMERRTQGAANSASQRKSLIPSTVPSTSAVASRPIETLNSGGHSVGDKFSSSLDGRDLLVENQTPIITSDIRGPKQVLVGRDATYSLRLHNQGDFAADDVVATVRIPSWADVVNTTTTRGVVRQAPAGAAPGPIEWHLQRLESGASETLEVKLIPRSSRPLELGMTWTSAPVGSRAVVEVQEPKLKMNVSGPEEVLFGKPQLYRLTLSNPGTGAAENVMIELMPPGGGKGAVTSHRLGTLPAGASKTLEVELTPRQAGKLQVRASATAEGGLASSMTKDIFCRKPQLEVDWRGPEMTYVGTDATYFFRVRNPGTAPANDVTMTVALPEGMELVSASEGQSFRSDRGEVSWQVGALNPGDDFYSEIKCVVHKPGENQLNVVAATASGDLADSKRAETHVVALADLKLDVIDPTGPVPVGEDAVYEIHVQNRGANTAQDVNVVGLFSDGIEPVSAEGAQYDVADGRVTFHTIDSVPAGREIVLRIHTKATQPGTHVFRAEVLCRDLEIKLASEETTRFFDSTSLAERNVAKEPSQLR